jgi:hypothetical protein
MGHTVTKWKGAHTAIALFVSPLAIGRAFANNPKPFTDKDAQRIMDQFNQLRRREREQRQ